jgi:ribulose-phosphate 3-epimerase
MIVNPEKYITQVRDTGAAIMNVHLEACTHLHRTIQAIKATGMKAAVTLNPATPVNTLEDIIADLDMVLLMSVNPGFGGQKFIEQTVAKTRRLRQMIDSMGLKTLIEVDGGVNLQTGVQLAQAGADALVAGSFIFNAANPAETISALKKL